MFAHLTSLGSTSSRAVGDHGRGQQPGGLTVAVVCFYLQLGPQRGPAAGAEAGVRAKGQSGLLQPDHNNLSVVSTVNIYGIPSPTFTLLMD